MFHGVAIGVTQGATLDEKTLRAHLELVLVDQRKIADIISRYTSIDSEEVESLFLRQETKDTQTALDKGIVHEIVDLAIDPGVPVYQLAFQRNPI